MEINYKEKYPEWNSSNEFCGPNRYVVGDVGDNFDAWNNVQIYHNRIIFK